MLRTFKTTSLFIILISLLFLTFGCTSVKPYQKVYLNDEEMDLKARMLEFNELNAESYREGASGANGGKAGGGCGCN